MFSMSPVCRKLHRPKPNPTQLTLTLVPYRVRCENSDVRFWSFYSHRLMLTFSRSTCLLVGVIVCIECLFNSERVDVLLIKNDIFMYNFSLFLVAPPRSERRDLSSHVSVLWQKMSRGPIDPPPPKFTHRVKVQSKMDQKVQCKGVYNWYLLTKIWVQSFKLHRLM